MVEAIPPINSHIDLSVGLPVKKRDTSELNESVAFTPQIIRATPTPNKANPITLFMRVLS